MTGNACCGSPYISLRMALIAIQSDVSALERESGVRVVVKRRRFPIHFIVTQLTVGWELSCGMRRIGRGVVVFQVARDARGGSSYKTLRMTLVACQCFMPTVQRKGSGRVVVERTGLPGCLRMAGLTFGAEPCSRMHRVGGGVVILQMTSHTSGGSPHKTL